MPQLKPSVVRNLRVVLLAFLEDDRFLEMLGAVGADYNSVR
jgi:hypothetical protein